MLDKNTVNKVMLMGRINREPRWHTSKGQRMLRFLLATGEKIKKGNEMVLHEETHTINLPESCLLAENLSMGDVVYVQGRLQTKMTVDENMVKHYRTEIVANSVNIITPALIAAQIND